MENETKLKTLLGLGIPREFPTTEVSNYEIGRKIRIFMTHGIHQ